MKIWTVTENSDNGIITKVVTSQYAADALERQFLHNYWWDKEKPLPVDMEAARDAVYAHGMVDSVHVTEHDLSDHPAIAAALAAFDAMQDSIQEGEDMACNDETAAAMDNGWRGIREALGLPIAQEQAEEAIAPTKTFRVEVSRTDVFTVEVTAEDEDEARELALEEICHADAPMAAFFTRSEGFETTTCNEVAA
jgi:hypothetical protein